MSNLQIRIMSSVKYSIQGAGDNNPVDYSESAKYLGVILDRKLNFKEHVQTKSNKAKRFLMNVRNAMGKLWGPNVKSSRWIYTAMVRPIVTYGSIVWGHKAESLAKPLHRLQRLALLCTGSFAPSTPTKGLEIILNYMPLDLNIMEEAEKTAIRIKGRNKKKWDYIGKGEGRGHLFYYRRDWGELDDLTERFD